MAAAWPLNIGASTGTVPAKSFAAVVGNPCSALTGPDLGGLGAYRGEPALLLSRSELSLLAEPFKNALVGRFALRRPSMEVIRKFFVTLGLKGECSVGLLDANHVLIQPSTEEDYTRLFVRRTWFIHNAPMTVSKWTLDFKSNKDSSIAPVWVCFPGLLLPLFTMKYLMKLGSLLGRPLQADSATSSFKRPSVARVLVEVDLAMEPVKRIWIGDDTYGHWQQVDYESWPAFCSFCQRAGHAEAECFRKNPALKPAKGAGTHGLKPTATSNKEGTTVAIEETNGSEESDKITMGDAVTPTERPGAPTLTPEVQRPGAMP
nr:uncharacterized protein LOC113718420 [Coffea arabica]